MQVFDLLTKDKGKDLPVREDAKKKINVVNLYEELVEDAGLVQRLIARAASARETGATGANEESSRSHCIMQFSLKRRDNSNEVCCCAVFHLRTSAVFAFARQHCQPVLQRSAAT